jgi:hypothetical protein
MPQNRDHFRIPFPIEERPQLAVGEGEFEILDLSECGARIVSNGNWPAERNYPIAVCVRFRDGTTAAATAVVHRQVGDQLILRFGNPLPYSLIAAEQRRLLCLYPRTAPPQNTPSVSNA